MKVLFLDRDGTLINEPPGGYIDTLDKLKLLPDIVKSLQKLQSGGYVLVMISNQPGLGTDKLPQRSFEIPQRKLMEIFTANSIIFEGIFFCPHYRNDNCNCMKPKTGLIDAFLKTNSIDLKQSYVVGDRESDIQLARNIGCNAIFYSDKSVSGADYISHQWSDIVDYILKNVK